MSSKIRIADYFFVASVQIDKNNIEGENPNPVVVDRFPKEDYEDIPFTENAEFFCLPEGARIEYREVERRKPYIFTFCFTQSDGSQSYGTSLVFYEKLKINGQICYNKYNQELYIPKALCILSLKPFFSCHTSFLKCLFKKAISYEEQEDEDYSILRRSLSRKDSIRKLLSTNQLRTESISMITIDEDLSPIEFDIRYYIEAIPFIQPGVKLQIPLFNSTLSLVNPPTSSLPFCDYLCLQSLFSCLSIEHIQIVLSTLLLDGKVVIHSQNKYQLTLCSTALLSLLKPVHYTLTYIPLLPPQLIDYIEAPTPFLIGIYSSTFSTHQQEEELQCLLVHLDYDRLTFPTETKPVIFPLTKDPVFDLPQPIEYTLLWEDNSHESAIFTVRVGPGMLGLFLQQEARQLIATKPGEPSVLEEVICMNSKCSRELKGVLSYQIDKYAYLQKDPILVEVNQMSLIGVSLKQATLLIASSPRPLTLRFQVGIRNHAMKLEMNMSIPHQELVWYYEQMRIRFFLFFVDFFGFYSQYMNKDDFNAVDFIKSLPDPFVPFVSEFVNTQLFEGLIQMYKKVERQEKITSDVEEEMKNLILLIKECIELKKQEEGIRKIHDKLHPANWNMKDIELPRVDYQLSSEMMNRLADRDGTIFPMLDDVLFSSAVQRLEVYYVCKKHTIIMTHFVYNYYYILNGDTMINGHLL